MARFRVAANGKLAAGDTRELNLCALKGLLSRTTSNPVTLVNAPGIAEQRGVELLENKSEQARSAAKGARLKAKAGSV